MIMIEPIPMPARRPNISIIGPVVNAPTMLPIVYIAKMMPVELPVSCLWKYALYLREVNTGQLWVSQRWVALVHRINGTENGAIEPGSCSIQARCE